MVRAFFAGFCAWVFLMLLSGAGLAQGKRVALVIGNSTYQHAGALANPRNDAQDMAQALKRLGFVIIEGFDLNKSSMDRKIIDFARELSSSEVGLFFYAGHGLQVDGQNYLVPTDAKLVDAWGLDFELVKADLVHRTMERATRTNLIFLDACRDNPLTRNLSRALGTRSAAVGKGLAAFESGEGTLISFSTQPGSTAADGTGRNSPYAKALLKQLADPKDDVSSLLIGVRNMVMQETSRRQVPWEHSALTARFFFGANPPSGPPATAAALPAAGARAVAAADAFFAGLSSGKPGSVAFADDVRLGQRGLSTKADVIREFEKLKTTYRSVQCRQDMAGATPVPVTDGTGFKATVPARCIFVGSDGRQTEERFRLEFVVERTGEQDRIAGLYSPDRPVLWQPRGR